MPTLLLGLDLSLGAFEFKIRRLNLGVGRVARRSDLQLPVLLILLGGSFGLLFLSPPGCFVGLLFLFKGSVLASPCQEHPSLFLGLARCRLVLDHQQRLALGRRAFL